MRNNLLTDIILPPKNEMKQYIIGDEYVQDRLDQTGN
jgi:hypothetical protein